MPLLCSLDLYEKVLGANNVSKQHTPYRHHSKETIDLVVEELSNPDSTALSTSRSTGVHKSTVDGIYKRQAGVIESRKLAKWQELLPLLREFAHKSLEKALESLNLTEKVSIKDALIAAGIAIEKGYLIEGHGVSHVAHIHDHRVSFEGLGQELFKTLARLGKEADKPQDVVLDGSE